MQAHIFQISKAAIALLLTLQVVLIGLAASAQRDHVRSEIFFEPGPALPSLTEPSQPRSEGQPPEPSAGPQSKEQGDVVLWRGQYGPEQSLWLTDADGILINRVHVGTYSAYRVLALTASALAAALFGMALLAAVQGSTSLVAAGGVMLIGAAHYAAGLSGHFELSNPLPLTIGQQLTVVALSLGVFVSIMGRLRVTPGYGGRRTVLAYASQSGSARALARRFQAASAAACDLVCLSELTEGRLANYETVLMVASTYGEGEPPDRAHGFIKQLQTGLTLPHRPGFAVLALGDTRYANFCAFGHQLHELMDGAGAVPLIPVTTVNRLDQSTIAAWWRQMAERFDWNGAVAQVSFQPTSVTDNECLNPDSESRHVHRIELDDVGSTYEPGDLLEIRPRFEREAARKHLLSLGLEPQATVVLDGERIPALTALERLEWQGVQSDSPQALIDSLPRVQARTYSLASAPSESVLRLIVRRRVRDDRTPGLISNQLCNAPIGESFQVAIRSNPDFHLPVPLKPIIMIGAGTGLAPFLGFLAHLHEQSAPGPHWLFFGEQTERNDRYMSDQLRAYQQHGTLHRYITAWSRDPGGQYIQSAIAQHKADLLELVGTGAHIYICGAKEGFGEAVSELLRTWFGSDGYRELVDRDRIRTDLY